MADKKRRRSSRRQASKKSVREVFFKRPWVLKSMMWAGKAAFFVWNIWHKFKDDLWTFYFFDIHIGQPCSMTRSG
ncbi:hypothetical protein [Limnohabitans sp.]